MCRHSVQHRDVKFGFDCIQLKANVNTGQLNERVYDERLQKDKR